MKKEDFIEETLKGGPGLDGYAYNAAAYCPKCAEKIIREIARAVSPKLSGTDDPLFSDSETCPQPIFFGEADSKQYCDLCGEFLY